MARLTAEELAAKLGMTTTVVDAREELEEPRATAEPVKQTKKPAAKKSGGEPKRKTSAETDRALDDWFSKSRRERLGAGRFMQVLADADTRTELYRSSIVKGSGMEEEAIRALAELAGEKDCGCALGAATALDEPGTGKLTLSVPPALYDSIGELRRSVKGLTLPDMLAYAVLSKRK